MVIAAWNRNRIWLFCFDVYYRNKSIYHQPHHSTNASYHTLKMDKQRRKLLQSSAILDVASSVLGLSGALGLQGCDSKPKQNTDKDLSAKGAAAGANSAGSTQHTKGEQQWNIEFGISRARAEARA